MGTATQWLLDFHPVFWFRWIRELWLELFVHDDLLFIVFGISYQLPRALQSNWQEAR